MSDPAPFTHAGGLVYRRTHGTIEVLLVRARPAPHAWVLPKGHIEPGETPEACARREVGEEAGVDACPEGFLLADRYTSPRGDVHVAFHLMQFVEHVPALETRETTWVAVETAENLLGFEGARAVVRAGLSRLTAARRDRTRT